MSSSIVFNVPAKAQNIDVGGILGGLVQGAIQADLQRRQQEQERRVRPKARGSTAQIRQLDFEPTSAHGDNPTVYKIDGRFLGERMLSSGLSRDFSCTVSEQFQGFHWCRSRKAVTSVLSATSILLGQSDRISYYNRFFESARFGPGAIQSEVQRLSKLFKERPRLIQMARNDDGDSGVIAMWGALTLTPITKDTVTLLSDGQSVRSGILVDFLGNNRSSAKQGSPVFRITGGAGYYWAARFNDNGDGNLRFGLADASVFDAQVNAQVEQPTVAATYTPTPPTEPVPVASASISQTDDHVIAKWSGLQPTQTRPFHVDGPWEMQWTTSGGSFALILHDADGSKEDLLASVTTAGSSTFYEPKGGDFYLQVEASEDWSARAVAVQTPSAPATPPPTPAPAPTSVMTSTPALVASTATPSAPPLPRSAVDTGNGPPQSEANLIAAVNAARVQYNNGQNDMSKGAARPVRAQAVCQTNPSLQVEGWMGKISQLSTDGDGKGVVAIEIDPGTVVTTWNNALSDVADATLIDPSSPLFKGVSAMRVGQLIRFSGTFMKSEADCFRESSMTLAGSISEPEYIMKFRSIEATP